MLLHRYIDACVFGVLIHTGMRLVETPAARVESNIEGATTGLASVAYILICYGHTNSDVRAPMRLLVYVCASGNIQFDSIWAVTFCRFDIRLGIAFLVFPSTFTTTCRLFKLDTLVFSIACDRGHLWRSQEYGRAQIQSRAWLRFSERCTEPILGIYYVSNHSRAFA